MDFGAPVAQNAQAPDFTKTLAGLMGLKQQQIGIQQSQQNLQRGAAETQMTQQSAQQRQGIANIDWSKYDDGTGTVSTDRMLSDEGLRKASGDQFLDILKAGAAARTQQLENKKALVGLNNGLRDQFGSMVGALRSDPDVVADNPQGRQKVEQAISQFGQAGGPDAQRVAAIYGPLVEHVPQGKLASSVGTVQLQAMDASRQAAAQQPSYTNTGGSLQQTNPQAAGAPASIATTLPPTTGTMGADGTQGVIGAPQADFSGVQGPQRGAILADIAARAPGSDNAREAVNALSGRPQGFVPQSLPAGQAQNIANNVDEMNRHFGSLQDAASGSALQQGLIGNIKSLASGAATGTGAGRKAFISGLLAAMHIPGTGDEAKDTDLLEKNMAQLNLSTPASTDAARTIVNAARPHGTMQEGAITEAADQLSGQIQANVAIRNALQGYKMMGDTAGYQAARSKLESIADPRAFQFEAAAPADRVKMLQKLTPDDRQQLRGNIQQLEQMGMFQ